MLYHIPEFHSFLKLNVIPLLCMYHILFIHSSVFGHLGCFHLLAVVNNAAMNMGVQTTVRAPAFTSFGYVSRSGIAGSYGKSVFNF